MALALPSGGTVSGATCLPRIASIDSLLGSGRPSAVPGLVIPIIVDPVKGHVLGTRPHVAQEALEGSPPFTDDDSPAAVTRVRSVPGVVDAPEHGHPGTPCGVVGTLGRSANGACRTLQRSLRLDLRSCLLRVSLTLHRMCHSRAVAAEIARYAVPLFVNRGKLSATARTGLGLQRFEATSGPAPLCLRDLSLGLC